VAEEQPLLPCTMDWDVYDAQREWKREGVFENGKWRVSYCNDGFRAIETYPDLIVVPSSIDDEVSELDVATAVLRASVQVEFQNMMARADNYNCRFS
jgi:hypothetical protein